MVVLGLFLSFGPYSSFLLFPDFPVSGHIWITPFGFIPEVFLPGMVANWNPSPGYVRGLSSVQFVQNHSETFENSTGITIRRPSIEALQL